MSKTLNELGNKKKELVIAEDSIREHLETLKDKEKRIEDLNGQLDSSNQRVATLEEELENTIKKGA